MRGAGNPLPYGLCVLSPLSSLVSPPSLTRSKDPEYNEAHPNFGPHQAVLLVDFPSPLQMHEDAPPVPLELKYLSRTEPSLGSSKQQKERMAFILRIHGGWLTALAKQDDEERLSHNRTVYETAIREAKAESERCRVLIAKWDDAIEVYESRRIEAQVTETETHIRARKPCVHL